VIGPSFRPGKDLRNATPGRVAVDEHDADLRGSDPIEVDLVVLAADGLRGALPRRLHRDPGVGFVAPDFGEVIGRGLDASAVVVDRQLDQADLFRKAEVDLEPIASVGRVIRRVDRGSGHSKKGMLA
jgi:hypothetical protein